MLRYFHALRVYEAIAATPEGKQKNFLGQHSFAPAHKWKKVLDAFRRKKLSARPSLFLQQRCGNLVTLSVVNIRYFAPANVNLNFTTDSHSQNQAVWKLLIVIHWIYGSFSMFIPLVTFEACISRSSWRYLAEGAKLCIQHVSYDIPSLKKHTAACEKQVCERGDPKKSC